MANGTRGDHPITDIVVHGQQVFAPDIDALIAQIDELGGWDSEFASLAILGWHSTWLDLRDRDPEAAEGSLSNLRYLLRAERDRLTGDR